jgi:hypothetical protein
MSGIEFRVGRTDHHKVEEFLSAAIPGVHGIRIDASNLRIHAEAAEAARRAGLRVLVEPLTERMTQPGFNPSGLDYGIIGPTIDRRRLVTPSDQLRFVEAVIDPQLDVATDLTPPHFFVESDDVLALNIALTRHAVAVYGADRTVQPILAVASQYLRRHAGDIAARYAAAGIAMMQVRISPLGGENVGPQAIQRAWTALAAVDGAGIGVTLGMSGIIGHVTAALGLADGFSTGIGHRERYDHRSAMAAQRRPRDDDDRRFAPAAKVYVAGADMLVPRDVARQLYADPAVRAELGCRLGDCALTLGGPLRDPRGHYLHARAHAVHATLQRPNAWRLVGVREELVAARALRGRLRSHFPAGFAPSGRTINSLIAEIDRWTQRARSA